MYFNTIKKRQQAPTQKLYKYFPIISSNIVMFSHLVPSVSPALITDLVHSMRHRPRFVILQELTEMYHLLFLLTVPLRKKQYL